MSAASVVAAPSAWKRATRSGGLVVGLVLAVTMVLIAVAAPWIAPYDPNEQNVLLSSSRLRAPVRDRCVRPRRAVAGDLRGPHLAFVARSRRSPASDRHDHRRRLGLPGGTIDRLITAAPTPLSFPQLIMG
jgi:peptide/nickel transport system permease protein